MNRILNILALLLGLHFNAQDIHFSQFFHAPLIQNPANTGSFDGDIRGVFNQRTQWRSITDPFNTWSLAGDWRNFSPVEHLNAGMLIFKDAAGTSPLRTVSILPSASYLIFANSDSLSLINAGLQFGLTQKSIDLDLLRFDNQYNGSVFDPSLLSGENLSSDKSTYLDINLGLNWSWQYAQNLRFKAGAALFHITSPTETFFNDEVKLDRRFLFHAMAEYEFNPEWMALPALQWQRQGTYNELLFGGMVKRTLLDKYGLYRAVYLGAFGRSRDAAYIVGAMDYDNWKVGISYDINLSDLRQASTGRGGFEFSVAYIFKGFKEKYKAHRICPNYI